MNKVEYEEIFTRILSGQEDVEEPPSVNIINIADLIIIHQLGNRVIGLNRQKDDVEQIKPQNLDALTAFTIPHLGEIEVLSTDTFQVSRLKPPFQVDLSIRCISIDPDGIHHQVISNTYLEEGDSGLLYSLKNNQRLEILTLRSREDLVISEVIKETV